MAGIHRSRTLRHWRDHGTDGLGMAGIHRSRTLGQPEPAEPKQVPAVAPVKKAESAPGFLQEHAVFCHKTPPFWRTGDR